MSHLFKHILTTLLVIVIIHPACSAPVDKGRVGQPPIYPTEYPVKEVRGLLLVEEPVVEMTGKYKAKISFKTAIPCPAARIYYGIFEPDQHLPLPRYRRSAKEKLKEPACEHDVTIKLKKLLGNALDVAGLKEKGGGVIVYRIEVYNPKSAMICFYDRRFEFRNGKLVPTVTIGPFVDQITETGAIISWDTDKPVKGKVRVNNRVYLSQNPKPAMHFEIAITGLEPGKTYPYRVEISNGIDSTSTPDFSFRTPEHKAISFSFAAMGDSREGIGGGENSYSGVNYKVVNRLAINAYNRGVDFIVHTGDFANGMTTYPDEFTMQLEAYKYAVEPVGHYIPIYEGIGNHEVLMDVYDNGSKSGIRFDKKGKTNSESVFAEMFVNPLNGPNAKIKSAPSYKENVYRFDYGNSRFIMMNNNYWWSKYPEKYGGNLEGYVLDDQMEWLIREFAEAKSDPSVKHLFLFAHEPMFPNGGHAGDAMWYNGGDPEKNNGFDRTYVVERRDEIWQAFATTGKAVCGNFCDEHNYNRTLINSDVNNKFKSPVWQIISGGAGAPFYTQDKSVPWASSVKAFSTQMHYYIITVDGSKVSLEVYGITGELIDEAVLKE
ncbi:MAG: metallophosphoesterase family protein [Candidatus Hatepunaea meridiana]|nr:metallophosphoesterase family protein [Candidatus Hatepunaea meridiana]